MAVVCVTERLAEEALALNRCTFSGMAAVQAALPAGRSGWEHCWQRFAVSLVGVTINR